MDFMVLGEESGQIHLQSGCTSPHPDYQRPHLHHSHHFFMPDGLPDTTFPIYPRLGQSPSSWVHTQQFGWL